MNWTIEFARLLDGAILIDQSATNRDDAVSRAFALIDLGHDVRSITAPDGVTVGAAAISEAYLKQFRVADDGPPREDP